jgi:hypothetical protein
MDDFTDTSPPQVDEIKEITPRIRGEGVPPHRKRRRERKEAMSWQKHKALSKERALSAKRSVN